MENIDIVSVCIITYNSSKYIEETLESVRRQTYPAIELIISDDASSDDTVYICEQWIAKKRSRFCNALLLKAEKNTGVCGNINRANGAANGRWIKGMAGDDSLMPDAIQSYVEFCNQSNCQVCVSGAYFMDEESNPLDIEGEKSLWNHYIEDLECTYPEQKTMIKHHLLCPGPPMFFSKDVWTVIGGCNATYAYADEWVMQYSMLKNGYKLNPLDKKLIVYRVSKNSLCHNPFETRSYDSQFGFVKDVIIPDLVHHGHLLDAWDLFVQKKTQCVIAHKRNFNYKYLLLMSPLYILRRLKIA